MTTLGGARVVVTGASGFIGLHLCRALRSAGARVVSVGRKAVDETLVDEAHVVDLTDRAHVARAARAAPADFVVHLASVKNSGVAVADYREQYETNLFVALNVVEGYGNGCRRFVHVSSCEEYGDVPAPFDVSRREEPISAYGVSKLAVTQLMQALARGRGFPAAVLRSTIVYGPGQRTGMFLPALICALLAGDRFPMTRGEQTRDYVYVDDVVDAVLRSLVEPDLTSEALHVSSGTPIRIRDLAERVARLVGGNAESLLDFGERNYRTGEAMSYWADSTRTRALLGWAPQVSLEEGLRRTVAYYRDLRGR
jgi:UDP-glucose 4-epimerase